VGISGGVDSAVSALLLKQAGFDVLGVHLYCWPPKSEVEKEGVGEDPANSYAVRRAGWIKKNGCRADEDRANALKTALEIGIPFKVLDFSEEYNSRIIKYFYDQYESGRTPNPDVLCNSEIKFGLFLDWAMANGFDYIATGHYAKLLSVSNRTYATDEVSLHIPADKHKDQTYFLWKLGQKELSHALFPLGDLTKTEVREIAKEAKLSVADKKDSQGICFVGNVEVRGFLARRLAVKKGRVLDAKGNVVGEHDGVWFYTIGQRGGWGWSPEGQREAARDKNRTGLPSTPFTNSGASSAVRNDGGRENVTPIYYVIAKDAKENVLVVGEADEATNDFFEIGEVNLIGLPHSRASHASPLHARTDLYVRIRHGGELIGARVGETRDGLNVELVKPIRGIASGQSAVFYSADGECLGGGVIV
jgi:tRNA-specific 2-thiouridylase